jgi:hypothetical protein
MSAERTTLQRPSTVARELVHFCLLDREQQTKAIQRMAAQGWSDYTIATATRLSVEMVRRVIGQRSRGAP